MKRSLENSFQENTNSLEEFSAMVLKKDRFAAMNFAKGDPFV